MLTIEELAKQIEPEMAEKEARLDIRLSTLYKDYLTQVYKPAGFRPLSAFILQAAIEKAETVIEKQKQILASERDKVVFFEAY